MSRTTLSKYIVAFCIFTASSLSINAQLSVLWDKTYGGSGPEGASGLTKTADGGFLMVGVTLSQDGHVIPGTDPDGSGCHYVPKTTDLWVVKVDRDGTLQWQNSLGGSGTETSFEHMGVIQDSDGNYLIALTGGSADGDINPATDPDGSGQNGSTDMWVIKLNSSGNIIWQNSLGGSDSDGALDITETKDGNYVAVGFTQSNDGDVSAATDPDGSGYHGSLDYWIVKLNRNNGQLLWQNALGGGILGFQTTDVDWAMAVTSTADTGVVVAGLSSSVNGDVSAATDPDGSGMHILPGNMGDARDAWIVKLNKNGQMVWQNSIGGSFDEWPRDIVNTDDGGFVLTAKTSSYDGDVSSATDVDGHGVHGWYDFWVVKLDSDGNIVWQNALGGNLDDIPYTISPTCNGGFIVGGISLSYLPSGDKSEANPNGSDTSNWMIRIDADGKKVFDKTFGSGRNIEYIAGITADDQGNYTVLSVSTSSPENDKTSPSYGEYDYWLVKFAGVPGDFLPDSVCAGIAAEFHTIASGLYNPSSYDWNFGDPGSGSNTSNLPEPTHTYTSPGTYSVTLIAEKDCVRDTIVKSIIVKNVSNCNISGIALNEESEVFSAYPNPVSTKLFVRATIKKEHTISLAVINILGDNMYTESKQVNGEYITTINMDNFPAGIYFIRLQAGTEQFIKRIIKQ